MQLLQRLEMIQVKLQSASYHRLWNIHLPAEVSRLAIAIVGVVLSGFIEGRATSSTSTVACD